MGLFECFPSSPQNLGGRTEKQRIVAQVFTSGLNLRSWHSTLLDKQYCITQHFYSLCKLKRARALAPIMCSFYWKHPNQLHLCGSVIAPTPTKKPCSAQWTQLARSLVSHSPPSWTSKPTLPAKQPALRGEWDHLPSTCHQGEGTRASVPAKTE